MAWTTVLSSAQGQGRARRLHARGRYRAANGWSGARSWPRRPSSASSPRRRPRWSWRPRPAAPGWRSSSTRSRAAGRGWRRSSSAPPASGRSRAPWRGWRGFDMRWWGWGEDGHDVAIPEHALELLRSTVGLDPAAGAAPVALEEVRLPASRARRRRARAAGGGRGGGARARRPRLARRPRRGAQLSGPGAPAQRQPGGAPDAVVEPARADQVRALLAECAAARRGGGALRRRLERGGRGEPGGRRLSCGDLAGPAPPGPAARGGPHLADGHVRGRAVRPGGRAEARGRGTDAGPLPAVVRVLDGRWLGCHPFRRPGLDRLRPHRRARGGAAAGRPGRRARRAAVPATRRRARTCGS